ncbi:MAG: hypothetical protein AAGA56_01065 [Myxococcota bacterium]
MSAAVAGAGGATGSRPAMDAQVTPERRRVTASDDALVRRVFADGDELSRPGAGVI